MQRGTLHVLKDSCNIPVLGAVFVIPTHVLFHDEVLNSHLDLIWLSLKNCNDFHHFLYEISVSYCCVLIRLHDLNYSTVNHCTTFFWNLLLQFLIIPFFSLTFCRTLGNKFDKDISMFPFKIKLDILFIIIKGWLANWFF